MSRLNQSLSCRCGDSDCSDTFGRATKGQDRSGCCPCCGWFDCDVCGWADPSGRTQADYDRQCRR